MTRIIKNRAVVEDSWSVLRLAEGETADTIDLPQGPVLVPLSVWHARKSALLAASSPAAPVGVWLAAGEGPESLADDLAQLSVIAVDFPKFTDGRGYSAARLLRERYGYQGEIRAIGDVLPDQLFLMARCGIDAFALRADKDADKALTLFDTFKTPYQAAVDQPQPLFRRRAA
ncbi:uncharacterized protein (DUF934 family) [Azospira oryzae]|uniref:Uncharacterized protein (DUF934 family) n=1 Tax=Azospira oryzae TaxID=146939 RepID=A0ABY0IPA4_9RHOO|nr:DUF934 domain-containing protein [Azospira oryzae]RZT89398.1 uncharacterized protein (DUF934 family) [Azospira oryzae]